MPVQVLSTLYICFSVFANSQRVHDTVPFLSFFYHTCLMFFLNKYIFQIHILYIYIHINSYTLRIGIMWWTRVLCPGRKATANVANPFFSLVFSWGFLFTQFFFLEISFQFTNERANLKFLFRSIKIKDHAVVCVSFNVISENFLQENVKKPIEKQHKLPYLWEQNNKGELNV